LPFGGSLLGLFVDPEKGRNVLLRNLGELIWTKRVTFQRLVLIIFITVRTKNPVFVGKFIPTFIFLTCWMGTKMESHIFIPVLVLRPLRIQREVSSFVIEAFVLLTFPAFSRIPFQSYMLQNDEWRSIFNAVSYY
jgi:hypothetical protein